MSVLSESLRTGLSIRFPGNSAIRIYNGSDYEMYNIIRIHIPHTRSSEMKKNEPSTHAPLTRVVAQAYLYATIQLLRF